MKKLLFVFLALLGLVAISPAQAQKKKPTETIKAVELTQDPIIKAQSFRLVGPFRGGRAAAGVGSYTDVNTFYMGSTGGGVWKTKDAGITWQNISDGFFEMGSVGAIAVAESDPNVLYVGMGEHAVRGVMTSHGNGVYKSTDAGKTWKHLGLELTRHIANIRIHPTPPARSSRLPVVHLFRM